MARCQSSNIAHNEEVCMTEERVETMNRCVDEIAKS